MKIFTATQTQALDKATIEREGISSLDLMERASEQLFEAFVERYEEGREVLVFAGTGNNGGDALALARLLSRLKGAYQIKVFTFDAAQRSVDNKANLDALLDLFDIQVKLMLLEEDVPTISPEAIVVDGIFGTGLNRPPEGLPAFVIKQINASGAEVFAIDIPSGLMAEENLFLNDATIAADMVLSFQFPKLSFLLSDAAPYIADWEIRDIGIDPLSIEEMRTPYRFFMDEDALSLWHERPRFSHKGSFGHCLMIAGKRPMMGAAILATKACVRTGLGLVTAHVPQNCGDLIWSSVPEALISEDRSELMFTDELVYDAYSAVAVGPALGTKPNSQHALLHLIQHCDKPLVLDADALNILALNKAWLTYLPQNSIITPHPGEFDRLTQVHNSSYERLMSQIAFAQKWQLIVVLKGAFTSIAFPDGRCSFNSTGHSGLATGGSGDVLTGIIAGLLAQNYAPEDASRLGVWWHGKAADLYAEEHLPQSLLPSDLIDYMARVKI